MGNNKKSPSARRRRRRILRILWLLVLLLVFLVIGLTMNWILTNDSEQIRADVSEFINDIKGVTPTPTPSPTPTPTNTPTPTPTNTPTPTPIAGRIIVDAGHGGSDDGATYNGLKEKDFSLDLALMLKERLEAKDYDVFLTRDSDDLTGPYDVNNNNRINPTERIELINSFSADLVISLHMNSYATDPSVSGLEILYGDNSELSKELADTLLLPVIDASDTKNRGVKHRSAQAKADAGPVAAQQLLALGHTGDKHHTQQRDQGADQLPGSQLFLEYQWGDQNQDRRLHIVAKGRHCHGGIFICLEQKDPVAAQHHTGQAEHPFLFLADAQL